MIWLQMNLSILQNFKPENFKMDPFPHIHIPQVLPWSLYKELEETYPEELMLKGVKPLEIANLGVANYKTVLKDIKEIQSSWLELDPEWFHRARLARIKSEQMYESQLKRLFAYLENEDLSYKEKLYVEGLVQNVITKLEEKSAKLDPEQYLNQRIKERLDIERKRVEETN